MPAGTVTAFDERRGLGTVTADGREYPFHTTQIADGVAHDPRRPGGRVRDRSRPARRLGGRPDLAKRDASGGAGVNTWQVGDVADHERRRDGVADPRRAGAARGTTDAVLAQPWLRPDFATDDGLIHLRIQLLVVESRAGGSRSTPASATTRTARSSSSTACSCRSSTRWIAAGFPPESIDTVVCTHLHQDHVGWNTRLVERHVGPDVPERAVPLRSRSSPSTGTRTASTRTATSTATRCGQ